MSTSKMIFATPVCLRQPLSCCNDDERALAGQLGGKLQCSRDRTRTKSAHRDRDWRPINTADSRLGECTQCRDLFTSAVADSSFISETLSRSSQSASNHGTSIQGCSRHPGLLERSKCMGCAWPRNRCLRRAELPFVWHCIMVKVKEIPEAATDANDFQGHKAFLETLPART